MWILKCFWGHYLADNLASNHAQVSAFWQKQTDSEVSLMVLSGIPFSTEWYKNPWTTSSKTAQLQGSDATPLLPILLNKLAGDKPKTAYLGLLLHVAFPHNHN